MKYLLATILMVLFVNVLNFPYLVQNTNFNFLKTVTFASDHNIDIAAITPTPVASQSAFPSLTPTPSPVSSLSAKPSPTPTPTPTEKQGNSNNTSSGPVNPTPTPTIIIPHPSYPAIITPFVQNTKQILNSSYKPTVPSGIVQILNSPDFYLSGQYAQIVKSVLVLLAIFLFIIGLILIDKSRMPLIREIKDKIAVRNKKVEGIYI